MFQVYFSIGYSWVSLLGTRFIGTIKGFGVVTKHLTYSFPHIWSSSVLFAFWFSFLLCQAWVNRRTPTFPMTGIYHRSGVNQGHQGEAMLLICCTPESSTIHSCGHSFLLPSHPGINLSINPSINQLINHPNTLPATIWLDPIISNFNNYQIHLGKGMWKRWAESERRLTVP